MKYIVTTLITVVFAFGIKAQVQPVILNGGNGAYGVIDLIPSAVPKDTTKPATTAQATSTVTEFDTAAPRHKVYSISSDIAQFFLFQPNLDFEYRVSRVLAIGANIGIVEPSLLYSQNPLVTAQFKDPGTVYQGTALRLFVKLYTHRSYWCLQGVYKKLTCPATYFSDNFGDVLNMYYMSEAETVFGLEFLHGHQLTKKGERFNADLFYGIGWHERFRSYTISDQTEVVSPGADMASAIIISPGNYTAYLSYLTPVIGLKFGWNQVKKDK